MEIPTYKRSVASERIPNRTDENIRRSCRVPLSKFASPDLIVKIQSHHRLSRIPAIKNISPHLNFDPEKIKKLQKLERGSALLQKIKLDSSRRNTKIIQAETSFFPIKQ